MDSWKKKMEKTLKIALKSPKSPYFFRFLEKKSFEQNLTLGLRKSFLNQTTYVLSVVAKIFLNSRFFLISGFYKSRVYCIKFVWYALKIMLRLNYSLKSHSENNHFWASKGKMKHYFNNKRWKKIWFVD